MALKVVVHIVNEEPFVADMEEMPDATASYVMLRNPRSREGNRLNWVTRGATAFLYPLSRIAFLEVVTVAGEEPYTFYSNTNQPSDE